MSYNIKNNTLLTSLKVLIVVFTVIGYILTTIYIIYGNICIPIYVFFVAMLFSLFLGNIVSFTEIEKVDYFEWMKKERVKKVNAVLICYFISAFHLFIFVINGYFLYNKYYFIYIDPIRIVYYILLCLGNICFYVNFKYPTFALRFIFGDCLYINKWSISEKPIGYEE